MGKLVPHTRSMRFDDDIVRIAIRQIGLAIVALIGWTGVYLPERAPAKWRLRRAGTRLKALEVLVRRLLALMALKLEVEPIRPRSTFTQSNATYGDSAPEASADVSLESIGSIEDIDFPKPYQRSFSLLPDPMDFSECPDFSSLSRNTTPVDIAVGRFTRRIAALQRVLEAPEAHAKRLARALNKVRNSEELRPIVIPTAVPSGLAPEIGILHGGIAFELREALKVWDSS